MSRWRLSDPDAMPIVVTVAQSATNVFFNLTIIPNVLELFGAEGARRSDVVHDMLAVFAGVMAVLVVLLLHLTRSVSRGLRGGVAAASPEALRRAGIALHKLPYRIAIAMSVQQMLIHAITIALQPSTPSTGADVCFVLAMGCGPLPICYAITSLLVAPVARQIATASRERHVEIPVPRLRLRWQLSLYTLIMCFGPVLWLGAVAYTVQAQQLSAVRVTEALLKYLGTVGPYGLINAVMLAAMITKPIEMMTGVIRTVARQGDVTSVGRVPHQQRDEVGNLANWTNQMIDRLEQTATERQQFASSLEALNHTLEQRVEDRTRELVLANAELEREIARRAQVEIELRQAQKLEAVGRLASGIAHEINTPLQFINDSISFVADATTDLLRLIERYRVVQRSVLDGAQPHEAAQACAALEGSADLEYLVDEVPAALARSIDGIQRVATIVGAMKEFAHPDRGDVSPLDLNRAITSTLTIARQEYKNVAELVTELGELPLVPCRGGDINQVILNLVVNAAHAIADAHRPTPGTIRIRTRHLDDFAEISIADTGTGIPVAIRERIFDPFFTTKEVGRGTGQGLAIARSIITKHAGTLEFQTEEGVGTTFTVRLPLEHRPP